jgi:hypothetical protein
MRKLVLLLTAVAAVAAVAFAAPAVAQAPPNISLSIGQPGGGPQGTVTTVSYGELVELSGDVSGATASGEIVDISVTPYRGETTIQQVRTDSTGEFTFTHRPRIRTSYVARARGGTSAQEPFAFVRPRLALTIWNKRKGQFLVRMRANAQNASHVVWFQRRVNRTRWTTVKRVRLSGTLTARFTARLPRGARWVRAVAPQTPGYLRVTSAFVRIR